ncbi:MAG TPA: penicillin acylase family protein [Chitinophagales bacterium]|nr:penicillin acylase family protein [Chitinophagales bacterium]
MITRLGGFIICCLLISQVNAKVSINREHIKIHRDEWGVPHIYAPTDEEVAYGLAWATAEDDFKSIQENYLAIRSQLGSVKGKDGAVLDFITAFLGINDIVEERIDRAFSPKFRKVLEYYCQGINDFAEKHPEQILRKGIFPATIKDMVAGYTLGMALMSNTHFGVIKMLEGHMDLEHLTTPKGSNAIAISNTKTTNGKTFLAINSHQPLEGPYSWYEAHLHSDEGWNILGGTFPGGATIFHGVNDSLGWAHTVSFADMNDIYKLKMNPKDKLGYQFDGKWLQLEKKHIWLKVKWWIFKIPIRKTFYKSVYGPTIKSKDGNFYSIRFAASTDIEAAEQWYKMNKAHNFNEFYQALEMQHIKGLNIVYADAKNNIFYLDNAAFPKRNPNYDWWKTLPGDTSATLWNNETFIPLKDLIQVKNPDCGFLFNTNNTPLFSSGKNCQPDFTDFYTSRYYFKYNNNRSLRMFELLSNQYSFSYEDFKRVKYDQKYRTPFYTYSMANIEDIFNISPQKYPEIADILKILKDWDRDSDIDSYGATIATLFSGMFMKDYVTKNGIPTEEVYISEETYVSYFTKVRKHLMKHFKTTKVPLGDFQKLVRGERELPVSGMMDVIATMWSKPYKDGKYKAEAGESYIMMVQWDKDGPTIETISPYGTSNHAESPHYSDQMDMFVNKKLKKMSLNYPTNDIHMKKISAIN